MVTSAWGAIKYVCRGDVKEGFPDEAMLELSLKDQADGGEWAGLEQWLLLNPTAALVLGAGNSVRNSECQATPLKFSSPRCLGCLNMAFGFFQLHGKSSLQEKKGPLLEDDSGLLEHSVFRVGSDPGRDLPSVGRWGLRDESDGPSGIPIKISPLFSLRPVDPLADNTSHPSTPDLCTLTLQSLVPAHTAFSLSGPPLHI